MKILFICKHNRFRSKVAEAFARKIDPRNAYFSAGVKLDKLRPWPSRTACAIARKRGYIIQGKPKKITKQMLKTADVLVIAADNVSRNLFRGFKGKLIVWKIPDAHAAELEKVKRIMRAIERRVRKLVLSIKSAKS